MKSMTELALPGLVIVAVLVVFSSEAGADCSADSTAGYVAFWRAWGTTWCGDGIVDTVQGAFSYWGIEEEPEDLVKLVEPSLIDDPVIRLSDLEADLTDT